MRTAGETGRGGPSSVSASRTGGAGPRTEAEGQPVHPDRLDVALARCGRHGRPGGIAEKLREARPKDNGTLVQVACCYCAAQPRRARQDREQLPRPTLMKLKRYAEEAVGVLRKMLKTATATCGPADRSGPGPAAVCARISGSSWRRSRQKSDAVGNGAAAGGTANAWQSSHGRRTSPG